VLGLGYEVNSGENLQGTRSDSDSKERRLVLHSRHMTRQYPDRYVFPAEFEALPDGIHITFPDLPSCVSFGGTLCDAFANARECLGLHLYGMEEARAEIPESTLPQSVGLGPNESMALIEVFMPPVRHHLDNASVKKTLTIPSWLNALAEQHRVNYSQLLQDALKRHLGLRHDV